MGVQNRRQTAATFRNSPRNTAGAMAAHAVIEAAAPGDKHCMCAAAGIDSPNMTRPPLHLHVILASIVALAFVGCRDERRHQASEISELEVATGVVAQEAAPQDVAKALLTRLAAAQAARERGLGVAANRDAYTKTMAEVRGLAARKAIFDTYRSRGGSHVPVDLKEEGAVRAVTDSWVSICAHYADQLESAVISTGAADANSATVIAEVVPPDAKATVTGLSEAERMERIHEGKSPQPGVRIIVRLVPDEGRAWRVLRVDLEALSTTMLTNPARANPVTTRPAPPAPNQPAN